MSGGQVPNLVKVFPPFIYVHTIFIGNYSLANFSFWANFDASQLFRSIEQDSLTKHHLLTNLVLWLWQRSITS
jgi:hypothetical protein